MKIVVVHHSSDSALAKRLMLYLKPVCLALCVDLLHVATDDPDVHVFVSRSHVLLPCLSPDMIATSFLQDELWHEAVRNAVLVIPVRLRPCMSKAVFATIVTLPKDHEYDGSSDVPCGRGLTSGNQDENGAEIASWLQRELNGLLF